MDDTFKRGMKLAAAGVGILVVGRAVLRRFNRYEFRGRTVLITGGSRGFGLVLARQLAAEGARLILCARDEPELDRAAADLAGRGADVMTHVCDVTDRAHVQSMIERVLNDCGAIDVVINNAGIIQAGPVETMTCEDYAEAIDTHLFGPLAVNEAVLPSMRQRGAGRIVNVSSFGGLVAVPHLLPYSASKFALVGYSLGLRSEVAKDGITVTTICPGLMRTGSPRNAFFKGQNRAEYAWFITGGSLPLLSFSAESAARQTLDACRHGDALVVLGAPMKLASTLAAMFPGWTAEFLAGINRLLPGPGGIGRRRAFGAESESALTRSPLTALTQRAAADNNQLPGMTGPR